MLKGVLLLGRLRALPFLGPWKSFQGQWQVCHIILLILGELFHPDRLHWRDVVALVDLSKMCLVGQAQDYPGWETGYGQVDAWKEAVQISCLAVLWK